MSENLFDEFDPTQTAAAAEPGEEQPAPHKNLFDEFDPSKVKSVEPPQLTGKAEAFGLGVAQGVAPTAGAFAGAGAGAAIGAAGAPILGPAAPLGPVLGAVAGGIFGAGAVEKAQNWALQKLPESWRDPLLQHIEAAEREHSTMSMLGGLTPMLLTMRPGALEKAIPPKPTDTALQRILSNPATARLFGGGLMGGMDLEQQRESGQPIDWTRAAVSTGLGVIFNKPSGIGETIEGAGERAVGPLTRAVAEKRAPLVAGRFLATPLERRPLSTPAAPTIAEARDMGILGPGNIEETFDGRLKKAPIVEAEDRAAAQQEMGLSGPDLHAIARRIDPAPFERADEIDQEREALRQRIQDFQSPTDQMVETAQKRRDELQAQLDAHIEAHAGYAGGFDARRLRAQIREADRDIADLNGRREAWASGEAQESEETASWRQRLTELTMERMDVGREIAAALRRADEHANGHAPEELGATANVLEAQAIPPEKVEIEPVSAPPAETAPQEPKNPAPLTPIDMRQRIADDVAQRLTKVGIEPEKAQAWGHVVAARFATRAAWRPDMTAEELYRQEGLNYRNIAFAEFQRERAEGARRAKAVLKPKGEEGLIVNGQKITGEAAETLKRKIDEAEKTASRGTDEERAPLIVNGQEITGEAAALLRKAMARANEAPKTEPEITREAVANELADSFRAKADEKNEIEAPTFYSAQVENAFFQGINHPKAAINLPSRTVSLFEKADFTGLVHEGAHSFLSRMQRFSAHPDAPEQLKADFQTVLNWFNSDVRGGKKASTAESIETRHHEKFARAFERYITEGRAPNQGLAAIFGKMKQWMLDIYQSLKGIRAPINDEIRAVFDRMLTEEPQRVVSAEAPEPKLSLADVHHADAETIEPHEAGPAADRIRAERERHIEENAPDELKAKIEAQQQEQAAAAEARPTGGGANEPAAGAEHGGAGGRPEPVETSGGIRPGAGEVAPGGGEATPQASGLGAGPEPGAGAGPGGERGDSPVEQLAPEPRRSLIGEPNKLQSVDNLIREVAPGDPEAGQYVRDLLAKDPFHFVGDTRGRITHGQILDFAATAGISPYDLTREIGQAHNAEELAVYKHVLKALNEKIAAQNPAGDPVAYERDRALRESILKQFVGARAESGRSFGIFRALMKDIGASAKDENFFQTWREITGKDFQRSKREAAMVSKLQSPEGVAYFLHASEQPTFGRMLFEYWVNGLISGPITHITYSVSNVTQLFQKIGPETAIAAALGARRSGERVRAGEVMAGLKGFGQGFAPALTATAESLRSGAGVQLPGEELSRVPYARGVSTPLNEQAGFHDAAAAGFGVVQGLMDAFRAMGATQEGAPGFEWAFSERGLIPNAVVKGAEIPLGDIARAPSRLITAFHSFSRALAYSVEKNALAYRQAAAEGLTGDQFNTRVAELAMKPPQEMMEQAHREATTATLMGAGGNFTRKLSSLVNAVEIAGVPVGKFIMPFVHISTNILDEALLKRTPLGFLSPEIRADLLGKNGPIAQDKAQARMIFGTSLALMSGALAAQGLMTGSAPEDPKERAAWQAAGHQEYSVKIGDTWYSYKRLGPLGVQLGIAADLFHVSQSEDITEAAGKFIHALAQNVLDESFVRGPADLLRAIHDPERYGAYYVRNELSSFLPYSVGMAQIARQVDPYTREVRSLTDALKNKIPFVSEQLAPKIDIWGRPLPSRAGLGPTAIWAQREQNDPVNQEMLRLEAWPSAVPKKIRGVTLTDDQHNEFARISGSIARENMERIVNSSQWGQWPDHVRSDVFETVFSHSRETARGMMMARHREIPIQAVLAKRAEAGR